MGQSWISRSDEQFIAPSMIVISLKVLDQSFSLPFHGQTI